MLQRSIGNRATTSLISGAKSGQVPAIQRMTALDTRWDQATTGSISGNGRNGVAIINDGNQPVVVKGGEKVAGEHLAAAQLLSGMKSGDGVNIDTPAARIADATESETIVRTLERVVPQEKKNERYENIVNRLQNPHTVVFSYVPGKDYEDLLKDQKHTVKKSRGLFKKKKRTLRQGSPLQTLVSQPGQIRALGRIAVFDAYLNNFDRIYGKVNLGNWRIDPNTGTIGLIDNFELSEASFFHDAPEHEITAQSAFKKWATDRFAEIAHDRFDARAARIVTNFIEEIGRGDYVRQKDKKAVGQALEDNRQRLNGWMSQGLYAGKQELLERLGNAKALAAKFPEEQRRNVMKSIIARRNFLDGMSAGDSWELASAEVDATYGKSWERGDKGDVRQGGDSTLGGSRLGGSRLGGSRQ